MSEQPAGGCDWRAPFFEADEFGFEATLKRAFQGLSLLGGHLLLLSHGGSRDRHSLPTQQIVVAGVDQDLVGDGVIAAIDGVTQSVAQADLFFLLMRQGKCDWP